MKSGWVYTLLIVAALTAGMPSRPAFAQESRDRRSYDGSRDRRRSYDDSRDRRRSSGESSRQSTSTEYGGSSASGFAAFSILEEKNIFDSQRQPSRSGYTPPAAPTPTAPIAESFALHGVLLDRNEAVAFFEGSSPEYNASVQLGGIIGGHKLVEIRTDRVVLASPSRKVELPVAFQMSHRAGGDWEVTTESTPMASSAPPLSSTPPSPGGGSPGAPVMTPGGAPPAPGAPAPSAGSANEMLRRLMERRRKEMGQ